MNDVIQLIKVSVAAVGEESKRTLAASGAVTWRVGLSTGEMGQTDSRTESDRHWTDALRLPLWMPHQHNNQISVDFRITNLTQLVHAAYRR